MKIILSLGLVIVSLLLVSCDRNRNLKITEVMENQVEIFLDEPSDKVLYLSGIKLKWIAKDGNAQAVTREVDLLSAGSLRGQQFLVVFEDPNHTGGSVGQNFFGAIPGIKVGPNFFPDYGATISVSMSVAGTNNQSFFFIPIYYHHANDLVRFGPSPRPPLDGRFHETGTLNGIWPHGNQNQSVSRRFTSATNGTPVDTDSESDWALANRTDGQPNPP